MPILDALGIHFDPNILVTLGVVLVVTFLGSKLFQRLGIPQVVGFITLGVVLGNSFLNLITLEMIDQLAFVGSIALGLIGFDMGSHLRFTIEQAGPVIYVLFFALVGARFQISLLPAMGMLGVAYIVLRSIGKFAGA